MNEQSLERNVNRLSELSRFEYNWDGHWASRFSTEVIYKAMNFIYGIILQPKIFPTANNSVKFEYESGDVYLEFEIFDHRIEMFYENHRESIEKTIYTLDDINNEVINKYLNR